MKMLKLLAPALLMFHMAQASPAKETKKPAPSRGNSQLGTSFRFDGSSLHGKYQTSPSATVSVENDKFMEDLLGARTGFQDRIERETERN